MKCKCSLQIPLLFIIYNFRYLLKSANKTIKTFAKRKKLI